MAALESAFIRAERDYYKAVAERAIEALKPLLDRYVNLINSGDAGNWDPETEPEVIAARKSLQDIDNPTT